MSEKSDRVVARTREMIVAITDPDELRRQLEEMLTEEFPPAAPPFVDGEVMTLQEFVNRFERRICRGVVPDFARREAWIVHAGERLLVSIDAGGSSVPKVPVVPPPSAPFQLFETAGTIGTTETIGTRERDL